MAPRLSVSCVVLLSFISTVLTVTNAFFIKKQFYPTVVYLTKSNTSMAVLYFQAAVISYLVFTFLRWIFFGQLRVAEVEHAQERVWHAIMETCLAFTVFRDDFSPKFVVHFVILFFFKAFHWLTEDRVDYMERSPIITVLFHARVIGILSLMAAVDSYFVSHAFFTTLAKGASAQLVFGFEYAILSVMILHITIKYILHIHDLRSAYPWENKAVYLLYAELFTNFCRCLLFILFTVVMIKIHTFPLFAIRPFYLTIRAFQKAINDVILSRRAIHAMNNLFPLATAQELTDGDNTCIICREEMTVESGAKKLPCNHIFHPNCLRTWFQRQQTCPTCRTDVLANNRTAAAQVVRNVAAGGLPNIANLFQPGGGGGFVNFNFQLGIGQQQQNGQQQPQQQAPDLLQQRQQMAQHLMAQQQQLLRQINALQQQQVGQQQQLPNGVVAPPLPQQQQQMLPYWMPRFQQMPWMPFFPPPPMFAGAQQQQGISNTNQQQTTSTTTPTNVAQPPAGTTTSEATNLQQEPETSSNVAEATNPQTTTIEPEQQTSTTSTEAQQQNSATQQQQPPSNMPQQFLPFGGNFPPMPPPPTFSGFSIEELERMSAAGRQGIEARLVALRNIQVLIDAAMLQWQHLSAIMPNNN